MNEWLAPGVLPMIGYMGEAPPERGAFLRFRYKKGMKKRRFWGTLKGHLKRLEWVNHIGILKGYEKPQEKSQKTGNSALYIAPRLESPVKMRTKA